MQLLEMLRSRERSSTEDVALRLRITSEQADSLLRAATLANIAKHLPEGWVITRQGRMLIERAEARKARRDGLALAMSSNAGLT